MQIRNEVEQAMLDAPQRSFDEICLSACDARASELKVTDCRDPKDCLEKFRDAKNM